MVAPMDGLEMFLMFCAQFYTHFTKIQPDKHNFESLETLVSPLEFKIKFFKFYFLKDFSDTKVVSLVTIPSVMAQLFRP